MLEASKQLGTCLTVIKSSCRAHGIPRWPYPEIQRISRTIEYLQKLLELDSQGVIALGNEERFKFETRCRKLDQQKQLLQSHPERLSIGIDITGNENPSIQHSLEQVSNNLTPLWSVTRSCSSEQDIDQTGQSSYQPTSSFTTEIQQKESSSTGSSHISVHECRTSVEQLNDTRGQQMDPCFLFLRFILRIGARGVGMMGPELVTEMARVLYPLHSTPELYPLDEMNQYKAEMETIQSRLQSLETSIKELKNQNQQLLQLLNRKENS